jgi:hypothetical protein
VFQRERGTPRVAGNSQASALTRTTGSGGKNPGTTRAGTLVQSGQSFLKEAFSPHADHFATSVKASGDPIVGEAIRGEKHHPGAHDHEIR